MAFWTAGFRYIQAFCFRAMGSSLQGMGSTGLDRELTRSRQAVEFNDPLALVPERSIDLLKTSSFFLYLTSDLVRVQSPLGRFDSCMRSPSMTGFLADLVFFSTLVAELFFRDFFSDLA